MPAAGVPGAEAPNDSGPGGDDDPARTSAPLPSDGSVVMTVDDERPTAGSVIRVTARGLAPDGSQYELRLGETAIATTLSADGDGRIDVEAAIPDGLEGAFVLRLFDTDTAQSVAAAELTITTAPGGLSTPIPVAAALATVLLLAFLFGLRRRRAVEAETNETSEDQQPAPPIPAAETTRASEGATDNAPAADAGTGSGEATVEPHVAGDAAMVESLPTGPAAAPALPGPVIPSRPWSMLHLGGTPLTVGRPTDAVTWDGALWITGVADTAAGSHVVVWSSLNGLTWTEPMMLGGGANPAFAADRTRLCVVAEASEGPHPAIWTSVDGTSWTPLAAGRPGQPAGIITSSLVAGGIVMTTARQDGTSSLWAGHPDGAWIQPEIDFQPQLLTRWGKHLLAFGHHRNGTAALARSEAGIRWTSTPLDAPPSFNSFVPAALHPLGDEAVLVGEDTAEGVAEAWVGRNLQRWDPAPIGASAGTRIAGGVVADGGLVVVGAASRDVSVWRTIRGIRWQRVGMSADLADFDFVAITRYEGRIHLLGMDQGEPVIWVRQAFPQSATQNDRAEPRLRVVVDDSVAVERPA